MGVEALFARGLAVLLVAGAPLAVAWGEAPRTLRFETYALEQGLAQETVTAVLQDREGFMWFGSQAGLTRYDGYRASVFRAEPGDPGTLADHWVSALFEDADGRLWVGTRLGLQSFDAVRQRFVTPPGFIEATRGNAAQHVQALAPERASAASAALWIGSADGLHRLSGDGEQAQTWRHDPQREDSLPSDNINALAWDAAGRLWVGTAAGLARRDPDGRRFDRFRLDAAAAPDGRHNTVLSLRVDGGGRMWVGTEAGLEVWQFDRGEPTRHRFGAAEGLPDSAVQALLEDSEGHLWVGTRTAGLLRWDAAQGLFIRYRHRLGDAHSLADDNVQSLHQDRSGTLWVGTRTGGASRVDLASGGFERHARFDEVAGTRAANKVYAITGAGDGVLWIGSVGGGLHRFDRGTGALANFRHDPNNPESLPHDEATALHVDAAGRHWVGGPAGLAEWDPRAGTFRLAWSLVDHADLKGITRIVGGGSDRLWLGTDGGLVRFTPSSGEARIYRHDPEDPDSIGYGRVRALLLDRRERLWVGTEAGLDRFDAAAERFRHSPPDGARPERLSSGRIHHIYEDRRGRLWVGTPNGLHRLDAPEAAELSFRRYGRRDGLGSDLIGATVEDPTGLLWVSTTAGLSQLDPESGEIRSYGASDGLIDSSFYVGAGHAEADGSLFFGGSGGLVELRTGGLRRNPTPPRVAITEMQVFNRPLGADHLPEGVTLDLPVHRAQELRLAHDQSLLTIEFAALHFADPPRNRYAYRMLGIDPQWVETDASRRHVTYSALAPGDYRFEVRASNKDGVWSDPPVGLSVVVEPPWWGTPWARGGALLLAGLALWTLYRMRVSGLTRQRTRLQAEVAAAVAETLRQKEAIEQANQNLTVLGDIGREITATLEEAAVVATLDRHVHGLLDATTFVIYRLDEEAGALVSILDVEEGKPLPSETIALDDPLRNAASCARERRELLVDIAPDQENPSHVPGTLHTLSALFAPLTIGDRLLGVMTIQSPRRHAYGERERVIFRTLCAYGAIALDNAATYLKLRATEARMQQLTREQQLILDNVAAAVFLAKDRTIQRCNRGMEEMLGYAEGELVGQSTAIYHLSRESWEAQGRQVYASILAGGVAEGEWEVQRKDGRRIWIAFRGRAVDPSRPEDLTIWIAQDVTERKRAEAELEEIRREQQIIFDNLSGGIVFTRDRNVVRCNRGVEEFLGFAPGTLEGQSVRVYFPSDEAFEEFGRRAYPTLVAGGVVQGEVTYRHRSGELIPAYVSGRALDPQDLSKGVVWMAQDIRQQKRDAAELERIRREQQIIFDNSSGGGILLTRDRIIVMCTPGLEATMGYPPGGLAGKSARVNFASDEAYEAFGRWAYPILAAGGAAKGEVEYCDANGDPLPAYVSGKAIDPADLSRGVVWMATDLRQQKKDAAALDRARRELQIIFDNNIGAIAIVRDGHLERCSRGFLSMYGYAADEAVGLPVEAFSASREASDALARGTTPELMAGRVVSGEFEYRRKDGSTGWLLYQGRALQPPDLAQGTIWLCQDISELKDQEAVLRESKAQVEHSLREVEQLNRQVSMLGELTGFLQACPTADEAFSCIGEFGPRLFAGSCGALYLVDEAGDAWVERGRWGQPSVALTERFQGGECWALRRSRDYRVDTPSDALCCPHLRVGGGAHRPYACLPLTAQGKVFGLLHIEHADLLLGDAADRRHGVGVAMAEQIALAIANVQLREALLQQSIRDPLTGLYNRRYLQEALFRELSRSRREHSPLALLMIDVDHFKRCNDRFGHPAGDHVLQHVARALESTLRAGHLACRFGGEEFSVLLPGCDGEAARRVAERILEVVRGLVLQHDQRPLEPVTVSIGLAVHPDHGGSPQSLIEAADAALYAAKQGGRDRVVASAAR